jgi:deoxyribodipyrimidine photo-lyase
MKEEIAIFWFRRDLRLLDNAGLYYALRSGYKVLPIFIFDENILTKLPEKRDRRVDFIHQAIESLNCELMNLGTSLYVLQGSPIEVWKDIFKKYSVKRIFANHDYEGYSIERDNQVFNLAKKNGISFSTFKDQCIFEKNEILSNAQTPYSVFTPYCRKWKENFRPFFVKAYPTVKYFQNFLPNTSKFPLPSLSEIGFEKTDINYTKPEINLEKVLAYSHNRDFPALNATTRLSVHLRFGTISIRSCVKIAQKTNETWLNELIWRDFYMSILHHFPHVNTGKSFKPAYDHIRWQNDVSLFNKWCEGQTGFPIVDAGMRELNATGFMHNRMRMITASFLCKDLLVDWRWGEAYFAQKLIDYDFSANNGGWQWASGSGCDAAPYFRIFNPTSQTERFDKDLHYIKTWVHEFGTGRYPSPIVDHKNARERTLKAYKKALTGE